MAGTRIIRRPLSEGRTLKISLCCFVIAAVLHVMGPMYVVPFIEPDGRVTGMPLLFLFLHPVVVLVLAVASVVVGFAIVRSRKVVLLWVVPASVLSLLLVLGGLPLTRTAAPVSEEMPSGRAGIGVRFDLVEEGILVERIYSPCPASRAGIAVGDVVVSVDGVPTKGFTVEDAQANIRGPTGSKVKLSLRRRGESDEIEVVVTRDRIRTPVHE